MFNGENTTVMEHAVTALALDELMIRAWLRGANAGGQVGVTLLAVRRAMLLETPAVSRFSVDTLRIFGRQVRTGHCCGCRRRSSCVDDSCCRRQGNNVDITILTDRQAIAFGRGREIGQLRGRQVINASVGRIRRGEIEIQKRNCWCCGGCRWYCRRQQT